MRVYTGLDLSRKRLDWTPAASTERSSTPALCHPTSMALPGSCIDWAMLLSSP
jgi:hypothetical protein